MPTSVSRARGALTLFSHPNCPRSHAMRLVVAIKSLAHDLVYVDPLNPPKDLLAMLPTVTLPTLIERDVVLYEPRIIAEYLDERFPHPPLLPTDPLGRARGRLTVFRIEQEWLKLFDQLQESDQPDTLRAQLHGALAESEPLFRASRFFLSPEIGLADCMLLPLLWRLPAAGLPWHALGAGIESYAQRLLTTPLFQRTLSDAERALVP